MSSTDTVLPHDHPAAVERFERETPSIGALVSDLTKETSELIHKEMELARVETANAIARLEMGVSSMAVGGIVVLGGFLVLLGAAVLGLDLAVRRPWLSASIVGGVAVALGAVLLALGKSRLTHLMPARSLRSLRRDGELVREHISGGDS